MEPISYRKKMTILSFAVLSLTLVGLFGTGKLTLSGLKSDVLNTPGVCTERTQQAQLSQYKDFLNKRLQAQGIIDIASGEVVVLNKKIADQKDIITKKQTQITEKNTKITEIDTYLEKNCKNPKGVKVIAVCNEKKQQKRDLNQDVQILKNAITLSNNNINQLTNQITNKQRTITQQLKLITRYTLFINEYEACTRQLNIKPILTSPLMSGEAHISGEVLVSGEVRMSGEVVIIGKTLVSGEVLISGEPCVSGEVRVPLYRLAVNEAYPAKAEIDEIHFDTAFGNPDTIKLTDWYITEEGNPKLLYKCSFLDNNQTQLSCLPGTKSVVNSQVKNYILSAKVTAMTGVGSLKVYKAGILYNGGKTDAINQTTAIKIHYAPKPVKTEIRYVSQFSTQDATRLPYASALDADGNIFVAMNTYIQKFDASGKFLMKFGSLGRNDGQLGIVSDIAIDKTGNIYTVDGDNNRIQKFDASGKFLMKFGTQGSGNGQFVTPRYMGIDASGNIYVADGGNNRIQKFDASGKFLMKFGSQGSGDGQFNSPRDISLDNEGNIYIADGWNYRIQKFDASGKFLMKFGSQGYGDGQFNVPIGIDIDKYGNIYVLDSSAYSPNGGLINYRIQKFDASGKFLMKFGSKGSGNGQFDMPDNLVLDENSNIYITDSGNYRIQKFAQVAVCGNEKPSITVLSPNGREVYRTGETMKVSFSTTNIPTTPQPYYALYLVDQTKTKPYRIVNGYTGTSPYIWTVPSDVAPGNYYVLASVYNSANPQLFFDYSDNTFIITSPASNLCSDSDGGQDPLKYGTITLNGVTGKSDTCSPDGKTVTEYYCLNPQTYGGSLEIPCPNGCTNGACLSNPPVTYSWMVGPWSACINGAQNRSVTCQNNLGNTISDSYCTGAKPTITQPCSIGSTCTDSDGGYNPSVKGVITYPNNPLNYPSPYDAEKCEGDGVWEMQCEWNSTSGWWNLTGRHVTCPNGCSNGACIVTDTTAPVITSLVLPTTSTSTKVPLTIKADKSPVSYLMIDGPTPANGLVPALPPKPVANDVRWLSTMPTSYNFTGIGSRTFFAWVKDVAGNVSDYRSAVVTINQCPEIMPPVCQPGEILVPSTGTGINGCPLPPKCALPPSACPVYPILPDNWCRGTLLPLSKDQNGCDLPPVCILQ